MTRKGKNIYPLTVDYGMSVGKAVKRGRYNWVDSNITSLNFPTKRKGTADITVELIHFNKVIRSKNARRKLDRAGYRPAELHELLAFGAKYPYVQRKFPIVALGSVWQQWNNRRDWDDDDEGIPNLSRNGSKRERELKMEWDQGLFSITAQFMESLWRAAVRFAAIHK